MIARCLETAMMMLQFKCLQEQVGEEKKPPLSAALCAALLRQANGEKKCNISTDSKKKMAQI